LLNHTKTRDSSLRGREHRVVKYFFEQRVFICNTFANYAPRFALNGNVNNLNDRYWCSENPPEVYLEVPLQYKEGLWCAMSVRKITKAHVLRYNKFGKFWHNCSTNAQGTVTKWPRKKNSQWLPYKTYSTSGS
jgi:hypothetical protein